MPVSLGIFNDDAFSVVKLSEQAAQQVLVPGQIGKSGVFYREGIASTSLMVEKDDWSYKLIASSPRGAPGETMDQSKRELRVIQTAHFQTTENIVYDQVQGVRDVGSSTAVMSIERLVQRKLRPHYASFDLTEEYLMLTAIRGKTGDVRGTLLDCFQLFGIATPPADITFDPAGAPKLSDVLYDLKAAIEDDLSMPYTGMKFYTGHEFHRTIWGLKEIRETHLNYAGAAKLTLAIPDSFEYGGFTFERYVMGGKAKQANGNANFIASKEAELVIEGVTGLYNLAYAPADYGDTINNEGLPRYVRSAIDAKYNKFVEFELQMNPIAYCSQPKVVRKMKLP